jgi:hypothetical protein
MNESTKERIYLDPKLNTLPDYYDRDIVKVLTKNLKEVYAFWGISSSSFGKILNAFNCKKEEVFFKLIVDYMQEDKVRRHKEIFLPPFTNNWFLQFEKRIKNLKVEVIAYNQEGNTFSLLHSAEISIPSHKPSKILHKDWLKPSWVQNFNMVEINGEYHIKEGEKKKESENFEESESNVTFLNSEEEWQEKFFIWPDGSSGFMGSSGILASSSNHLRKSI